MKLYKKTTLLEVISEGPKNSMVREKGPNKKIFLMPTQDLRDMYEEVNAKEQRDKEMIRAILSTEAAQDKSGYKLEY